MRIITGARKRCNIDNLIHEFKWPTLDERRKLQKTLTIGRLIIKRFPNYLLNDLPTFYPNSRTIRKNTFATPPSKHDYYTKSFVPASVELWNNLPVDIRSINSFKVLKSRLKQESLKNVPNYYHYGRRHLNILHTKLRLGCSDLNHDKSLIGISDINECICGDIETAEHYLLECGRNLVAKIKMLDSISDLLVANGLQDTFNVDLLLYGTDQLSEENNKKLFSFVQLFIAESKRFS